MNIAITGEGVVCAAGLDKASLLRSLREGKSGVARMQYLQPVNEDLPVGEVKLSTQKMRDMLGVKSEMIGRTPLMGIMAVREALEDAGLSIDKLQKSGLRIVLVSGTTVGGMDISEQYFREFTGSANVSECLAYHDCGCSTKVIANYFGVFADYTTISTACSSAANAIILGARLLESGYADIVVAGGSEALSLFHFTGFSSLMILDKHRCRPFDAGRQGLNLGEGAGFVVMETLEMARRRNSEVHAYLRGYGNACDAFHQTATSPGATGAYLAMTEALGMSGLEKSDIQYINAHGTGTANNDATESTAIRRVFGSELPEVSSTKPFTGHTTSASGSIEAIISIMAIQDKFIPENLGWTVGDADVITPSLGEEHADVHNVICNSFGFGGNDSTLVLSDRCGCSDDEQASATENAKPEVRELSRVDITEESQLAEIGEFVKPMELRRMGKLMRASILSTIKALGAAHVSVPDAIITSTARGCLENSEKFACQMLSDGEQTPSPTLFMQSTHNTMASMIAIRLKCHGYNMTYSQEHRSLEWALRDARMLIESGRARTVLVEYHDEYTDTIRNILSKYREVSELERFKSTAIVLSC